MPLDDWVYETGSFQRCVMDAKAGFRDYYSMNGRVRKLEILDSSENTVASLELSDSRDPQVFFGLNLAPGRYRFVVSDTYRGTHWEDTCIAEISFIQMTGDIEEILYSESFFAQLIKLDRYY